MYNEEHEDEPKNIHVFNSKSASIGETLIGLKVQEFEEMGCTFEEVVEFLKNYAEFDAGEVSESTQLIADLGLDSIRLIAIAEDSERKYGIFIGY